jgi:hypothetical protein
MEHLNLYLREHGLPSGKGACPRTDDILSRDVNLSVGVMDPGLGAEFGIHIDSSDSPREFVNGVSVCRVGPLVLV